MTTMPNNQAASGMGAITRRFRIGRLCLGSIVGMRILIAYIAWGIAGATVAIAADASKSIYEANAKSALEALATKQRPVSFLLSVTNLPPSVSNQLARVSGIADAGQPYSDGCVGSKPRRRFLLASKAGRIYNVAFEQGGLVPTWYVWQFVVDATGQVVDERQIEQPRVLQ